ncbi:MAG: hypothetical protein KBC64_03930, partial [Simkaniaceae bacterium]|nr:hypothetical protein [Simkaniaceae bacterium]
MESLDSSKGALGSGQFYIYTPHSRSGQSVLASLEELANNLKSSGLVDPALLKTLASAKYNGSSNAITFTGDQASLDRVQAILPILDSPDVTYNTSEVFVYKIQNRSFTQLQEGLKKLANSIPPGDGVRLVLEHSHYIPESNSIIFSGPAVAINKIKEILPSIDSKGDHPSNAFLIYTPHTHDGETLLKSIKELGDNLKNSGLADPEFLMTIQSAKFNPSANAITFTGDQASLDRINAIMPTLDASDVANEKSQLFVYPIQNRSKAQLEEGIQNLENTLPKGDSLRSVLENVRYLPESHSFAFRGSSQDITKLKELLIIIDSKDGNTGALTFSLYKLKNASGDFVLKELRQMADHLQSSGIHSTPLIRTIDSIKYIKSTNSLYITGTPDAIQEVTRLIPDFDVPSNVEGASNFYMYKPKYTTLDKLKTTLMDVAEDFKAAGLEDPTLIQSILTARTIEATQSILFTGPPTTMARIQELVAGIDTPENAQPIKQVGSTTFLIYKLKHVSGPQLTKSLRNIIADLQKTGEPDPDLIKTIEHMRFVPETNSVIFTGTKDALTKVQALADRFDVENGGMAVPPPEGYVVYKPKNLSGEELIQVLHDFEHNLTNAGVDDKELIDTINNLKWMSKTSTILVSGSNQATKRCLDLLEKFDISSKDGTAGTSIETIDDTSFLLYKLQYHQGNEIQTALQAISRDVRQNENATTANTLSNTIASIQWLQVTNTLIGSGNAQTLDKVRELIKGLDAPLKQVFIEVLVIELADNNSVSLGLNWRQSGVWRNKLAFTA